MRGFRIGQHVYAPCPPEDTMLLARVDKVEGRYPAQVLTLCFYGNGAPDRWREPATACRLAPEGVAHE